LTLKPLRALPRVPASLRLKQLLKVALRCFNFRLMKLEGTPPDAPQEERQQ
jgi:hypothetical protein